MKKLIFNTALKMVFFSFTYAICILNLFAQQSSESTRIRVGMTFQLPGNKNFDYSVIGETTEKIVLNNGYYLMSVNKKTLDVVAVKIDSKGLKHQTGANNFFVFNNQLYHIAMVHDKNDKNYSLQCSELNANTLEVSNQCIKLFSYSYIAKEYKGNYKYTISPNGKYFSICYFVNGVRPFIGICTFVDKLKRISETKQIIPKCNFDNAVELFAQNNRGDIALVNTYCGEKVDEDTGSAFWELNYFNVNGEIKYSKMLHELNYNYENMVLFANDTGFTYFTLIKKYSSHGTTFGINFNNSTTTIGHVYIQIHARGIVNYAEQLFDFEVENFSNTLFLLKKEKWGKDNSTKRNEYAEKIDGYFSSKVRKFSDIYTSYIGTIQFDTSFSILLEENLVKFQQIPVAVRKDYGPIDTHYLYNDIYVLNFNRKGELINNYQLEKAVYTINNEGAEGRTAVFKTKKGVGLLFNNKLESQKTAFSKLIPANKCLEVAIINNNDMKNEMINAKYLDNNYFIPCFPKINNSKLISKNYSIVLFYTIKGKDVKAAIVSFD